MREAWPDLWFDSPEVRAARRLAQKQRDCEELWAWVFLRRFSIYISLGLARLRGLTPNHVTLAAVSLAAGTALWIASPASPSFVAQAALYNLIYLLDCIDGELARLTGRSSRSGLWLDNLLWMLLLTLPLAVGVRLLHQVQGTWVNVAFVVLILNALFSIWLTAGAHLALGVDVSHLSVPVRKRNPALDVSILCLGSEQGMFLGLPIVEALFGKWGPQAVLVWYAWHMAAAGAKNVWRARAILGSSGRQGAAAPDERGIPLC
ncbi:MAG: CDP-alcohol phosphatidyltransferase family protein [Anaerolineae bacterium]|nr:CDP-alcohol phosphatidyltransferase family protein [Anaerolineae bacterium]